LLSESPDIVLKSSENLEQLEHLSMSFVFLWNLVDAAIVPLFIADLRGSRSSGVLAVNSLPTLAEVLLNKFQSVQS